MYFQTVKRSEIVFDHNFSRSALVEPSFCIVAKLEELNNFYFDCFESYRTKNASFDEIPGYLARARARARARPSAAWGPPARIQSDKLKIRCCGAQDFASFSRARRPCCALEFKNRSKEVCRWFLTINRRVYAIFKVLEMIKKTTTFRSYDLVSYNVASGAKFLLFLLVLCIFYTFGFIF